MYFKNELTNAAISVENIEKMRFRREADGADEVDEADVAENRSNDETVKDQNGAISSSIRDLNYKMKYLHILSKYKILFLKMPLIKIDTITTTPALHSD